MIPLLTPVIFRETVPLKGQSHPAFPFSYWSCQTTTLWSHEGKPWMIVIFFEFLRSYCNSKPTSRWKIHWGVNFEFEYLPMSAKIWEIKNWNHSGVTSHRTRVGTVPVWTGNIRGKKSRETVPLSKISPVGTIVLTDTVPYRTELLILNTQPGNKTLHTTFVKEYSQLVTVLIKKKKNIVNKVKLKIKECPYQFIHHFLNRVFSVRIPGRNLPAF